MMKMKKKELLKLIEDMQAEIAELRLEVAYIRAERPIINPVYPTNPWPTYPEPRTWDPPYVITCMSDTVGCKTSINQ